LFYITTAQHLAFCGLREPNFKLLKLDDWRRRIKKLPLLWHALMQHPVKPALVTLMPRQLLVEAAYVSIS
jgi:hypothetical protein